MVEARWKEIVRTASEADDILLAANNEKDDRRQTWKSFYANDNTANFHWKLVSTKSAKRY